MIIQEPPWILEEKTNICLLNGEIEESQFDYVSRFVFEKNLRSDKGFERPDHLKLIINSLGGDAYVGFGIIDMIKSSQIPVWTYGIGLIASAGLLIFMSGNKGNRYIFKNTAILSHQWSSSTEGKKHEIQATEKEHKLLTKRMYKAYEEGTGLSLDEIKTNLLPESDIWLSPSEAIKWNLADKIITKI